MLSSAVYSRFSLGASYATGISMKNFLLSFFSPRKIIYDPRGSRPEAFFESIGTNLFIMK
jgi:hypothetical protein